MKRVLKVLISIIIFFVIVMAGGMFYLTQGLKNGQDLQISGLNMADVKDGVYDGKYSGGRWSNQVNVTVKDKKITDIKIVDDVSFAKPEVSGEIISRVIKAQDTKVDTVSGATVTSKAYLKAIENAFIK